jgi:ATP-dependent Clp protease adaptor protein ClpS
MNFFNSNIFNSASESNQNEKEPSDTDVITGGFTLILFNDDYHSFEEVIFQVIKATGCSMQKAEAITFSVHNNGKAVVLTGDLNRCVRAQAVLEEISLRTSIEVNS